MSSRTKSRFVKATLLQMACLCLSLISARAQQVLVQANVAEDTVKNSFGPNRQYFGHGYVGYGMVAGRAGTGAAVRYGFPSAEVQVGLRFKRRFTQTLALNLDLRYSYLRCGLVQNNSKTVPTATQHQSESLGQHRLQPELSLRLNAGRRGNVIGHYLDLLVWGSWVVGTNHVTEDVPGPGVKHAETTETGLHYIRRFGGGLGARLGADRYALVGRYRLSSAFSADYAAFSELPRWVVGFEIGLF